MPPFNLDKENNEIKTTTKQNKREIVDGAGSGKTFMINRSLSLCCRLKKGSEKVIQMPTNEFVHIW